MNKLGKVPMLNLGMRLEKVQALLSLSIIRASLACHNGMVTFAEAVYRANSSLNPPSGLDQVSIRARWVDRSVY